MEQSLVQVRMKVATIAQVDSLKERLHAPSRSDAIRRAIELSDALTRTAKNGDRIIIEGKSGKREVIIPGLQEES